jgi:hypothetical protein
VQNRKYLFDNLKDGDLIGFHFKSLKYLAGVFIGKVTGKTGNDLKVPGLGHIGLVANVKRSENIVFFSFCEYKVSSGKTITNYSIIRDKDGDYLIDSYFKRKNVDIYHAQIKTELNEQELEIVNSYWKVKEDYSIVEAILSPNWAERILKFVGIKKSNKENNFCSGGIYDCLKLSGRSFDKKNDAPTPVELINNNIFNKTNKICF